MVSFHIESVRPSGGFGISKQWAVIKYFHAGEGRPFAKFLEVSRHNSESAARKAMMRLDRESIEPVFDPNAEHAARMQRAWAH